MVQVDPHAATTVYVNTPRGGELTLDPGREVVARVVAAGADGSAKINLGGQVLDVTTAAPLRVGDDIRLAVSRADATGVRLAIVTPERAGTGLGTSTGPGATLVQELAKAGVPVTPQLANAAAQIAEQLGGGSAAARAVANLASRDLALSPVAAGRVAAALDMAGSIGPSLASLAARSGEVAAALPSGTPTAAALRSLLAPGLSSSELAVARIVQSAQASAPGGPITLPSPPTSANAAVVQNYMSSQVAVTSQLDQLAAQNTTLGAGALLQARGIAVPASSTAIATPTLAQSAVQSALRGQLAAAPTPATLAPPVAQPPAAASASTSAATVASAAQQAAGAARANANAAAATGAANATPTPTGAPAAGAIADLANLAARFAGAVAPGSGGIGASSASAARGMNAAEVAQQAGRAGAAGAAASSVAGASSSGDPRPLVTALQAFMASPHAQADAAKLLQTLGGANPAALATAIRTLPESQALQLAGQLLDLLPDSAALSQHAARDLRAGVHAALDQLGRALVPPGGDDIATLRHALEHVANHDARPVVAHDAARLLAAVDGQQILSRTASGADPGYVYFQVPLPDGRGAEVLVRREPGRRQVSFDEFRIAFLLDTERLGTLMIELDAHPAGIRADVRTDLPELEPYLRARTEQLIEPLARESRRPVVVTTGVFDQDPPASLLEPQLGVLEPGRNEFYA
jgi:hypothetical protein